MPKPVTAKSSCCKDKPRCKRCPVVLKRLADAGSARRTGKRTYVLSPGLSKAEMKAARSPRKPAHQ